MEGKHEERQFEGDLILAARCDPLLLGAIDMHYHGYPELSLELPARLGDVETLELARSMGMGGIVFKSNLWPTMGQVYNLRERVPGIEAISSITLNSVAGGLNPWVVEAAATQGAKVVWLPTWSSPHRAERLGVGELLIKTCFPSMSFEPRLSAVDSSGTLLPEVKTIIRLVKDMDLVLCTGHLSPTESLAIAAEAEKIDFCKLVCTHPISGSVGATLDEMKELAKRGAYIEVIALNVFLRPKLDDVLECITEVGPECCVLGTDAFTEWVAPCPEFMRMFIGVLLHNGIDSDGIATMARDNPTQLLGLPPKEEGKE